MDNIEQVRVKKKYILEVFEYILKLRDSRRFNYTFKVVKESGKDSFTLDEFLKFREGIYYDQGWFWDKMSITISKEIFYSALKRQEKGRA